MIVLVRVWFSPPPAGDRWQLPIFLQSRISKSTRGTKADGPRALEIDAYIGLYWVRSTILTTVKSVLDFFCSWKSCLCSKNFWAIYTMHKSRVKVICSARSVFSRLTMCDLQHHRTGTPNLDSRPCRATTRSLHSASTCRIARNSSIAVSWSGDAVRRFRDMGSKLKTDMIKINRNK